MVSSAELASGGPQLAWRSLLPAVEDAEEAPSECVF